MGALTPTSSQMPETTEGQLTSRCEAHRLTCLLPASREAVDELLHIRAAAHLGGRAVRGHLDLVQVAEVYLDGIPGSCQGLRSAVAARSCKEGYVALICVTDLGIFGQLDRRPVAAPPGGRVWRVWAGRSDNLLDVGLGRRPHNGADARCMPLSPSSRQAREIWVLWKHNDRGIGKPLAEMGAYGHGVGWRDRTSLACAAEMHRAA